MNCYLIDYENIKIECLNELKGAKEKDRIIFFYSDRCKNITLDIIDSLVERNIQIGCSKVIVGAKNALDFQLASYLGYQIGKAENGTKYYIFSNDKGFDCLCEYWREQNVSVQRISSEKLELEVNDEGQKVAKLVKKKSKVKDSDILSMDEIRSLLADSDEPEEVLRIFNQYKTKQAICNEMSKYFKDSKRASGIYKKLKPLLKEKHKS